MKNSKNQLKRLILLALFTAILAVMAYTPLGYLHYGVLEITFNIVPVALAAVTLGPSGGAVVGAVFGITSFLQCVGIGGTSAMGVVLFEISPIFTFILTFVPRMLDGLIVGYIFKGLKKIVPTAVACSVSGFFCAFLNTVLFMLSLVLLFGNTEYMQGLIGGKNIILFICTFVGINAVFEMIAATLLNGAIGTALFKAKVVPEPAKKIGGSAK